MSDKGKITVHGDPDLKDLIPGFLEKRRKDVVSMREALDRGDFERIRVLGHSMKGAGGGYGFDEITRIGAALEQAAKRQDSQGLKAHIQELELYLQNVEVIYE